VDFDLDLQVRAEMLTARLGVQRVPFSVERLFDLLGALDAHSFAAVRKVSLFVCSH
jgi:hypothetical protein